MGSQESGLRKLLNELRTLHVNAVPHRETWQGHQLRGYYVSCPQLDYHQVWFTYERQWQHVEYPLNPQATTIFIMPSGLDYGAVVYAVGVAIIGDLLAHAVHESREHAEVAPAFGIYIRECELFLQRSIRTMVTGGYAYEAHQQADLELKRHLRNIQGLAGYDGIFGTAFSAVDRPSAPDSSHDDTSTFSAPNLPGSRRGDGTSLLQFTNALRTPAARRLLGIDMSDTEGFRVANNPTLVHAYYRNWISERDSSVRNAPLPPQMPVSRQSQASTQRTPPQASLPPHHAAAAPPRPHSRMSSIVALSLGVLAYLLAGGWLSLALAIAGFTVGIRAIVGARAARGRSHVGAALAIAIIGVVASGAALLLWILYRV